MSHGGIRCDVCGKFRSRLHVVQVEGEGERWVECFHCMSPADREFYFRKGMSA